jgi:predicted metalloprotease with PDZ domain
MPEGYPGRGRIGIEVQAMTAELREFFDAPAAQGVLIVRVEKGRPAELARILVGDVVIAAAGEPLVRPQDLVAIVARASAGAPLALTIVRQKRTRTIQVIPDGEPASAAALEAWYERVGEEPEPVAPVPTDVPIQPVIQPDAAPVAPDPDTPSAPAPAPAPPP